MKNLSAEDLLSIRENVSEMSERLRDGDMLGSIIREIV